MSASYRTDIPAFHAAWFRRRLAEGWVAVRNPYGRGLSRVSLRAGDVDGFVFWTRNAAPFMPALEDVAAAGVPFVVQFTATGYPRPLDRAVIRAGAAAGQAAAIADRFGPGRVVWRYDPVVFTDITDAAWHRANFARLAAMFAGVADEVVVSVATLYAKTRRGMETAAARHGFGWQDPDEDAKRALIADLVAIAGARGIALSLCAQPAHLVAGVAEARCIDRGRLARIAGHEIAAPEQGNRPGCRCARARDIGAYDTCAHGCVYCYAVRDRAKAARFVRDADPAAAGL